MGAVYSHGCKSPDDLVPDARIECFRVQFPQSPEITGVPFNDAYRYMDWLLTVPLLLMEIVLVMNLSPEESNRQCWTLGAGSALMIVSGYKGELKLTGDLSIRRASWCLSMCFFLYIVYTLLACLSWCTYPIVYTFPMLGFTGTHAGVGIQMGYCISDIISKCGVGLMIYQITIQKSRNEAKGLLN